MAKMGMAIRLKPEMVETYKRLHASPWPEMDAALKSAHIRDYSIFLKEPENLLFGVWVYDGDDFEGDMKRLGDLEVTRRWLALTAPCQTPFDTAQPGEWWSFLPCVYHLD
jgi:L-rhamnose mutarotase